MTDESTLAEDGPAVAYLDLPAGTARVLLGDLLDQDLIRTSFPTPSAHAPTEDILEAVMHELRSP
jgi:hypothetical protein